MDPINNPIHYDCCKSPQNVLFPNKDRVNFGFQVTRTRTIPSSGGYPLRL